MQGFAYQYPSWTLSGIVAPVSSSMYTVFMVSKPFGSTATTVLVRTSVYGANRGWSITTTQVQRPASRGVLDPLTYFTTGFVFKQDISILLYFLAVTAFTFRLLLIYQHIIPIRTKMPALFQLFFDELCTEEF
jgi:hypothetical protein